MVLTTEAYDTRLSNNYLLKTVRNVRAGWNAFLASVTIREEAPPDPLARLRVRRFPRVETGVTFGNIRDHTTGQMRLGWRRRIPNPDPATRAQRPFISEHPMYGDAEKAGFSKILPCTFICTRLRVHPRLYFGIPTHPPGPLSGICVPFHEIFARFSRAFMRDAGTFGRHFDVDPALSPHGHNARIGHPMSYEALLRGEGISGTENLNEVLARLRLYAHGMAIPDRENLCPPGLLIVYDPDLHILLEAVKITIKRAYDLKFCLLRKFGVNLDFPIYLYRYDTFSALILSYRIFNGHAPITEIINDFAPGASIFLDRSDTDAGFDFHFMNFLQGLFQTRVADPEHPPAPGFDRLMLPPDHTSGHQFYNIFFSETLRTFLDFMRGLTDEQRTRYAPFYRDLYRKISKGLPDHPEQVEERITIWGFRADFAHLHPKELREAFFKSRVEAPLPLRSGRYWKDAPVEPLMVAAVLNDLESARRLLNGALPRTRLNPLDPISMCTPFYQVVFNNNVEMTRLFLTNPNIAREGGLYLYDPARADNPYVLYETPLHRAIKNHSLPIVRLFVTDDLTNINIPDYKGREPLMASIQEYFIQLRLTLETLDACEGIILQILRHRRVDFDKIYLVEAYRRYLRGYAPVNATAFLMLYRERSNFSGTIVVNSIERVKRAYVQSKAERRCLNTQVENAYIKSLRHPRKCHGCRAFLFMGRRNHCRACLNSFCNSCIREIADITGIQTIKYCNPCRLRIEAAHPVPVPPVPPARV